MSTTVAQYTIELGFDDTKAKAGIANYRSQLANLGAAGGSTASQLDVLRNSIGGVGTTATQSATNTNNLSNSLKNEATSARQAASANDNLARSTKNAAAASQAGAAASRSHQAGMAQLGQQFQDVSIQAQMGVEPLKILAMQGGQVATAFSLMDGAAGKVGSFMAGPWGVAIMIGVSVLGSLGAALFSTEKKMAELEMASDTLGQAQGILGQMFDLSTGKIINNTQALRDNLFMQIQAAKARSATAATESRKALVGIGANKGFMSNFMDDMWAGITSLHGQGPDRREYANRQLRSGENSRVRALTDGIRRDASLPESLRQKDLFQTSVSELQNMRDRGVITAKEYEKAYNEGFVKAYNAGSEERLATQLQDAYDGKGLSKDLIKPGTPAKPRKPKDTSGELKKLAQFGENAAEKIKRISEEFDAQPKLVDKVSQSTRALDSITKDLMEKKPQGFKEMIKDAEKAKTLVAEALLKPFNDMNEAADRQSKIQSLILAGREDEAVALQMTYQLVDKVGFATEEQRKRILANVEAERKVNEEIARRKATIDAYNGTISDLRSNLESLFSGRSSHKDFIKGFAQSIRDLQAKLLTESMFGGMFRELEEWVKKESGVKSSVDIFNEGATSAGEASKTMATTLESAADRVDKLFRDAPVTTNVPKVVSDFKTSGMSTAIGSEVAKSIKSDNGAFGSKFGDGPYDPNAEIVVTGTRSTGAKEGTKTSPNVVEISQPSVIDFVSRIQKGFGDVFSKELGKRFGQTGEKIGTVIGNAYGGFLGGKATAGTVGGVLGGLKGLADGVGQIAGENSKLAGTMGKLSDGLGKALGGAQTGTMVAGMGKQLWGKFSTTGSQIGGSIGAMTGIPGGDIIGSILGGIVGGLFKKTKKASQGFEFDEAGKLVLGNVTGNSGKFKDAAAGAGGEVVSGIYAIAEKLGANLQSINMASIGIKDGRWRVDPDGSGDVKVKHGAVEFGKDGAEAAIAYVIKDALKKGVITGLSDFSNRIVRTGEDAMINLALSYETILKDLDSMKDPVGSGLRSITKQMDDMVKSMKAAGATATDLAKIEEYRSLKLTAFFEEQLSGLKDFREALDGEGSGVTKYNQLLAKQSEYEAMKADKAAGKVIDQSKFIELGQSLFGLARDVYGTSTSEFQSIRGDLIGTTDGMIASAQSEYDKAMQTAATATAQAASQTATNTALSNEYLAQVLAAIRANGKAVPGSTVVSSGIVGGTVNGSRESQNPLL